jgi:hypothetical protein
MSITCEVLTGKKKRKKKKKEKEEMNREREREREREEIISHAGYKVYTICITRNK